MGWWEPLWKTISWAAFIFILCPSAIWLTSRLIFQAYFVTKKKFNKGEKDGEKQKVHEGQNKEESRE